MYKIIVFLFCVVSSSAFAQDLAFELGYKYKHSNSAQIGLSYKFYDSGGDFSSETPYMYSRVNVSGLTDFNEEHALMGGIQFVYYIFEAGLNVSTKKDIEPTLGINIFNHFRLNAGYNMAFEQKNNPTFGVSILSGHNFFFESDIYKR